jgi:lipopolysaccharide/colanic/teichoic acid biosynthesis glycosyltransferase
MKRALDVLGAAVGLVACSPVLLTAAVAVRVSSPGPIIFMQERVGRGGKIFKIRKFRTMRNDTVGASVTAGQDPRITRVGRWLRSTKIDELPQLWNVLRGDMSLVGPRPEVPQYVELWPTKARTMILSVRPGITDPASIEFRREAEELGRVADPERHYVEAVLPRKVELYCSYVRSRTLRGDLAILLQTLRSVASG